MKYYFRTFLFLLFFFLPLGAFSQTAPQISVEVGEEISVTYILPEGYHQTFDPDYFYFELTNFTDSQGKSLLNEVRLGEITYPEGIEEEGGISFYGTVTLSAPLVIIDGMTPGSYTGEVEAHYQLCQGSEICYIPQSSTLNFTFVPSTSASATSAVKVAGASASSLLTMLLFALLGGLLLNVMPCVFPILSIRGLNLVRQSGNDKKLLRTGSLLYGAGVLSSFIVLSAVVMLLKHSGELAGWGFQFQNSWFVFTLAAILFAFALSLFDVFVFMPPVFGSKLTAIQSKGLLGSYMNGLFAVILATPCTAPFLGSALGFAFSQPLLFIFFFFITIGIGFSLPFVLLGFFPRAIQWIPKPGAWMDVFKELMGLVLFATAIYFFSIYVQQVGEGGVIGALYFLLSLASAFWLYGKLAQPGATTKKKWIALVLLITIPLVAGFIFLSPPESTGKVASVSQSEKGPERLPFSPEIVQQLRSENKPVFLIFSAQWCSVCKLNDRRVLQTSRAKELFTQAGVTTVYGDYTSEDPLISQWILDLGRAGVPVYALYLPGTEKPLLLPEILTFETLEEVFAKIKKN